MTKKEAPGLASVAYTFPTGSPVHDWGSLNPGDGVQVRTDAGSLSHARVDTVNPDGSILWIAAEGIEQRTLHLKSDPLTLYRP